jgi:hypothetical protein
LKYFNISLRHAKLLEVIFMQDKSDFFTMDFLSVPMPGRPRTSTPEKRKADAAERARRYRQSKKSDSPGRIVNTHDVKLCRETEDDLIAIYNWARWLSQAVDANDNPSPCFFGSLFQHTSNIMDRVQAIATRSNVVWCNPPVNPDFWLWDREE